MHVDLLRDKAKALPAKGLPAGITSLTVWHCSYKTLEPSRSLLGLRSLVVATYPDESFEYLTPLVNLQSLRVLHFPKAKSLAPLGQLQNLVSLRLECLPSWDASSKRLVVESLAPLAELPSLKTVHLLGVVPQDYSLAALEASRSLAFAGLHGYPKAEVERFFRTTQVRPAPSEA